MPGNLELAHSFNIRLTPDILRQLRGEQELLAGRFKELRGYDSSPHLAIATKFMGVADSGAFADALAGEFGQDAPWELEFADFRHRRLHLPASGGDVANATCGHARASTASHSTHRP